MPRPKGSPHLSDEAVWLIVCNSDLSAPVLGRALKISESTVRNRRAVLRRRGWSCSVVYVPCRHCDGTVTVGGKLRRDHPYHRDCRPEARREIQRRLDRRRWEQGSEEWPEGVLRRCHSYEAERQAETVEKVTTRGRRSTPEEDALLLVPNSPAYVLAEKLVPT